MTEVQTERGTILFSYSTPVAACMKGVGDDPVGFIKTDCRWSVTTTKHINKWLEGAKAVEMPQSFFDSLA
jgi:hypothetical protein